MNKIKKLFYSLLTNEAKKITNQKIIEVIYKTNLNKISEINEKINKMLKYFVIVVMKQICFFFDKCIKENIQLIYLKEVFTIILQKLN